MPKEFKNIWMQLSDSEKQLFYTWTAVEDGELKICVATPPEFDAIYNRLVGSDAR